MQCDAAKEWLRDAGIKLHPDLARAEQISDEIGELSGYLNAANCRLPELIAEFDELAPIRHRLHVIALAPCPHRKFNAAKVFFWTEPSG